MKLCLAALLTSCLASAAIAAGADAQGDRSACMVDAETYCGQFIPDRVQVAHCLIANLSKITPACREAVRHFK